MGEGPFKQILQENSGKTGREHSCANPQKELAILKKGKDIPPEIHQDGEQRAPVGQDLQGDSVCAQAQEMAGQHEVPGAGNGQKFGHALQNPEDRTVENFVHVVRIRLLPRPFIPDPFLPGVLTSPAGRCILIRLTQI